jgi:transposase
MVNELNRKMQKQLEDNISRVDKRMEALLTILGIGRKTAIELVTVTDGFGRFDSARTLASYVGICPRIWESGSSV